MVIPCSRCPLRRLPLFAPFSTDELAFMERFKTGEMEVAAGTPILSEGASSAQLFTVLDGLGLRHKTLSNGRRQVINFLFPGDFIGLQASLMGEMDHSAEASTKMTLCVFDRAGLFDLFKAQPRRAYDMTWLVAAEENFLGEALATIGQRSAIERISWSFVKLIARAEALEIADGNTMPFPFRQQDLADALGLSLVHTNKTLAKLRARDMALWGDGWLEVRDRKGLSAIAGVEPAPPRERPLM